MSVQLFIIIFAIEVVVSGLLTEAIKKAFQNADNKNYSANIIALIDAFMVGGFGTAVIYYLYGLTFTVTNILVLIVMVVAIWMGSMVGFDKIMQSIKQIQNLLQKEARN
jgi:hypothetical protein